MPVPQKKKKKLFPSQFPLSDFGLPFPKICPKVSKWQKREYVQEDRRSGLLSWGKQVDLTCLASVGGWHGLSFGADVPPFDLVPHYTEHQNISLSSRVLFTSAFVRVGP